MKKEGDTIEKFAVIDTETNWNDEVMSIGIVVADSATKKKVDSRYYIIDPEYKVGGMFSYELRLEEEGTHVTDRKYLPIMRPLISGICRNIRDICGMTSCVWQHTANIIRRYRIRRNAIKQED